MGVGLCLALNWLSSSIIGKVSPLGVRWFGSEVVILIFGIICIVLSLSVSLLCYDNGMGKISINNDTEVKYRKKGGNEDVLLEGNN